MLWYFSYMKSRTRTLPAGPRQTHQEPGPLSCSTSSCLAMQTPQAGSRQETGYSSKVMNCSQKHKLSSPNAGLGLNFTMALILWTLSPFQALIFHGGVDRVEPSEHHFDFASQINITTRSYPPLMFFLMTSQKSHFHLQQKEGQRPVHESRGHIIFPAGLLY